MPNVSRSIFPIPATPNPTRRWQMLTLYSGIVVAFVAQLPLFAAFNQTAGAIGWGDVPLALIILAALISIGAAYVSARHYNLDTASKILVVMLLAEAAFFLLADSWDALRGWAALWASVLLCHLLLGQRAQRILLAAALAVIVVAGSLDIINLNASDQQARVALMITAMLWVVGLAAIGIIVSHGINRAINTAIQDLASRHLIEMGQHIVNHVSARTNLDTALQNIANDLVVRFSAIDHVQIYLVETAHDNAVLIAATGAVGQQLLRQEHALSIGGLSPIGRATLTGTLVSVTDYRYETIHSPHELLVDMQSELAIPLKTEDRVIGALDIQSRQVEAFPEANITLFSAIANQLTIAVDALQLYGETQRSLRENRALYEQTQLNLREIERLNYQLTGRAWSEYLRLKEDMTALTVDLDEGYTVTEAEWTPTLNEAAKHRQVITVKHEGQRIVSLPIIVRNEVVGAMEFELPSDADLPEGATELLIAVGQRLGLALENRRLFDETQRIAQREGLINDIGAELQAATSVDAIIQRTARHLQETLSAEEVTIRISRNAHGQ